MKSLSNGLSFTALIQTLHVVGISLRYRSPSAMLLYTGSNTSFVSVNRSSTGNFYITLYYEKLQIGLKS